MPTFKPFDARDKRCQAANRRKTRCGCKAVPGKRVCRLHGGLSTGPRTPEGRAKVVANLRAYWQRYRLTKAAAAATGEVGAVRGADPPGEPQNA